MYSLSAEQTLTINGIKDFAATPNTLVNGTIKFGTTPGAPLVYRIYFQNAGYASDTLAHGMTNAGYPYNGGNTYNLPNGLTDAGGRGDNYFSVVNGWLVPPQSGLYTFGIATDDDGALYISTDDTAAGLPATATLTETGWAPVKGYVTGGVATRTGTRTATFQAGKKYYFRVAHRNGTGGDNVDITWQLPGGAAIADGDPAIDAQYIIPEIPAAVPLAIAGQPTNQTVVQARPVVLTVSVVGVPAYSGIQWYKNGNPLPNASGLSITFASAALTDQGTYYAVVSNLAYTVQSSNAVLTVTSDTVPPAIVSVTTRLGGTVYVQFSEALDPVSAANKNNYVIAGETITGATLDASGTLVSLTVTPKITGKYGVVVSNVKDLAGNTIAPNTGANGVVLGVTPGMIAYWPLDTVVGTKTPDVVSGYDMTLQNLSASDLVPGKWGKAFRFDFNKSQILWRDDAAADALPVITKNPSFTISMWVNGASGQVDRRVWSEAYGPGLSDSGAPLFVFGTEQAGTDGKLDIMERNDTRRHDVHYQTTGVVLDGTWHHLCLVQSSNSVAYTATFYIDGVADPVAITPDYPFTVTKTAIGGIMRAASQAYFTGMIDDVAVWNRALDLDEIVELAAHGTPVPPPVVQPLAIHKFSADLAAVAQGDSVTLRWDVSKDADKVEIQPNVGDVTTNTLAGAGTVSVTLNASVAYTLTIHRGVEKLSQMVSVAAIGGVASGWVLLDNFDRYDVGALPTPWTAPGGASVVDVNGNRMLSVGVNAALCALPLTTLSVLEGQQTTLFTRFYLPAAVGVNGIDQIMGLTDKGLRFLSDELGDLGPGIRMQNPNGDLQVGTKNGNAGALELNAMTFQPGTVYNLWIDITNDTIANGDLMSIYVAKDVDTSRTTLFSEYRSDRNPNDTTILGPTQPNLIYLVLGANTGTSSVYFDDFYLSKSGYNATVPHAYGFTSALVPVAPPTLTAVLSGKNVVISWPKDQGTGYTLQWATSVNGTWSGVGITPVDAGANSTVTVPANESVKFFRLKK